MTGNEGEDGVRERGENECVKNLCGVPVDLQLGPYFMWTLQTVIQ